MYSQKGAVRWAYSVGAVVFRMSSPRKASWISHNKCFDCKNKSNCIRKIEKGCLLEVNHSNSSNKNRMSVGASKTAGCKPTRMVREGCGSTESGVCSFVLGTYHQRGSARPPSQGGYTFLKKEVQDNYRKV